MKLTPLSIVGISVAALVCIVQIILDFRWSGEINQLRAARASSSGQLNSVQNSVDAVRKSLRQYDDAIGPKGSVQLLAKRIESGEMDLAVKSLKIISSGKPLVSLDSSPDAGGVIQVFSNDGTATAEIASAPGKTKIDFKTTQGADAALVTRVANYSDQGFYVQKGPTDDVATRTDGAGLQIRDDGTAFFMAQSGGGNVLLNTLNGDERAKVSVWADGSPKRVISLSLGAKDASPFVSVAGALSGDSATLLPERLSLVNQDGTVVLAAAEDDSGGFVFVNDKTGARRGIMTSGSDGHGSISVYGNDKRSNTLFPEYNIQTSGSNQK
jgi:hypothetical protein